MRFGYQLILCGLLCLSTLPTSAQEYVAGGAQWKPYAFKDDSGQLKGLSVDIARRVLRIANVNATFVTYPVNRLQVMLDKGEIDINYADALVWNTPEQRRHFVFSKPYLIVNEHLYFLASHPAPSNPISQWSGLTIGMIRGYTYAPLEAGFKARTLSKLETSEDNALLKLLVSGRVDAIAMVDDIFDVMVQNSHLSADMFRQGAELSEAPLVFKLQPQHALLLPQINNAIDVIRKNGVINEIVNRYQPTRQTPGCASAGSRC